MSDKETRAWSFGKDCCPE